MESRDLFEILAREQAPALRSFLRAAGCDHATADDVWQETMLIAWRRIDEFDRSRPFGPWLRGIASRVLMGVRRKQAKLELIGDENSLEYLNRRMHQIEQLPGDTLDEKLHALRDCITLLPAHERECVELRYQQDLMPQGIGERIGSSVEAVKKRLVRAKQHLLECLERKVSADVRYPV